MDILDAAKTGDLDRVDKCLSHGVDINTISMSGCSPLYLAARYNHVEIVKYLLQRKANTELVRNGLGWTALMAAANSNHVTVMALLLKYGANANAVDKGGQTALWISSYKGYQRITELLVENQADHRLCKFEDESCPLYVATLNNHLEVAELLLKAGAEVNSQTKLGATSLYIASQEGYPKIVQLLINHGADVNIPINNGATPIYVAVERGQVEVVTILLKHGADTERRHGSGASPLLLSCSGDHSKIMVELLCQSVGAVNEADDTGNTPLHSAVLANSTDIIEVLLTHGAQMLQNHKGYSPLDIAKKKKYRNAEVLLQKYFKKDVVQKKANTATTEAEDSSPSSAVDREDDLGTSKIIPSSLIDKIHNLVMKESEETEEPESEDMNAEETHKPSLSSQLSAEQIVKEKPLVEVKEMDKRHYPEFETQLSADEKDLSNEHLFEIATKVGDLWKQLAPRLGLDLKLINRIEQKHSKEAPDFVAWAMLKKWRDHNKKDSLESKKQQLLRAARRMGNLDIEQLL